MRPVLYGDVTAAARAILAAEPGQRARLLLRMLAEAEAADAHRLATGRAHPLWGTGSLMSAALAYPTTREPCLDDRDYAACMAQVFDVLVARADSVEASSPQEDQRNGD